MNSSNHLRRIDGRQGSMQTGHKRKREEDTEVDQNGYKESCNSMHSTNGSHQSRKRQRNVAPAHVVFRKRSRSHSPKRKGRGRRQLRHYRQEESVSDSDWEAGGLA